MEKRVIIESPDVGFVESLTVKLGATIGEGYLFRRIGKGAFGLKLDIDGKILTDGGIYVLSFKGRAQSYRTLAVQLCDSLGEAVSEYTYKLNRQCAEFSMPFYATLKAAQIKILFDETVGESVVGDFDIVKSDSATFLGAKSGYSMVKDGSWETIDVGYTESRVLDTSRCTDVLVTSDGYIYALVAGSLQVYKENGTAAPDFVWKDTVNRLGEARQMDISESEELLALVARSGGVHIYDIKNREAPVRVSHFDTLEMATGLDICKDYLYIADRVFGVSIYNIEDPSSPKIVSCLSVPECQDVTYYNGFVYCGVWGAMQVCVFDVRDIDSPKHISDIPLSGRGDGVTLSENLLYVATGHHERGQNTTESVGYGVGNGMEIWDISDPHAPVCLSVVRCDGRVFNNSPDIWRIRLADKYAFLSSSYAGLYVFDVSDPISPVRLAHINVCAAKGEVGYKDLNTRSTFVYPYDTSEKMNAPIIGCDVYGGILYMAGHSSALHAIEFPLVSTARRQEDSTLFPDGNDYAYFKDDFAALGFKNPKLLSTAAQFWSVKAKDEYLYAAAGVDGIYVLDSDLNILNRIKTDAPCHDIAIYGNVIYTAESTSGLGIYYIGQSDPKAVEKHSVTDLGVAVVQSVVAPGGKFVLCHANNSACLVDVKDHSNVTVFEKYPYPMFYQRQISIAAAKNRYLWCYSSGGKGVIVDFGENGSYDRPVSHLWSGCSIPYQTSGITAEGDCFFVANNASVYFVDPSDEGIYEHAFKESGTYKAAYKEPLDKGAPQIIGDYLFLCHRRSGRICIYKWESADHSVAPAHIQTFDTKGYPTVPVMIGKRVYLPMGYEGLISFDL